MFRVVPVLSMCRLGLEPVTSDMSCGIHSTRYNRPDKRFFEVPQFYPTVHKSKNTLAKALLLMFPEFGMICLMRSVLAQHSPVLEKG